MELKEIQELVKLVSRSNVSEVDIKRKDFEITIKSEVKKKKGQDDDQPVIVQQVPQPVAQPQAAPAPTPAPAETPAQESKSEPKADESTSGNTEEIKSPMIGTFYRSPSPDKPPFVNVGDTIQKGDVICIIEAMKLFNEIEAEVSGTVVKVVADDASPVEYDQPLFIIEPA